MNNFVIILLVLFVSPYVWAEKYDCQSVEQIFNDPTLDNRSNESVEDLQRSGLKPTKILVSKRKKRIYVFSGDSLLRSFRVAFGRNPVGPKIFEGDNKTPEGRYFVDFKKEKSEYYLALRISYPNAEDLERTKRIADSRGVPANPGGDIMIHGFPNDPLANRYVQGVHPDRNWTRGCIAVTNDQIREIYQLVAMKTEVEVCSY